MPDAETDEALPNLGSAGFCHAIPEMNPKAEAVIRCSKCSATTVAGPRITTYLRARKRLPPRDGLTNADSMQFLEHRNATCDCLGGCLGSDPGSHCDAVLAETGRHCPVARHCAIGHDDPCPRAICDRGPARPPRKTVRVIPRRDGDVETGGVSAPFDLD